MNCLHSTARVSSVAIDANRVQAKIGIDGDLHNSRVRFVNEHGVASIAGVQLDEFDIRSNNQRATERYSASKRKQHADVVRLTGIGPVDRQFIALAQPVGATIHLDHQGRRNSENAEISGNFVVIAEGADVQELKACSYSRDRYRVFPIAPDDMQPLQVASRKHVKAIV